MCPVIVISASWQDVLPVHPCLLISHRSPRGPDDFKPSADDEFLLIHLICINRFNLRIKRSGSHLYSPI